MDRRQVEDVFQDVLDVPRERRPEVLRVRCGHDDELRVEVERLVRAHEAAEEAFLESPAIVSGSTTLAELREVTPALAVPHRVGPYDIIRVLGEGGMGVVYEARQQNPNRTVALKVIRPGQGSTGMIKRFQREADVLGHLHHPGIAYIYEAGSGRVEGAGWSITQPYIAMELIRGEPLTKYAASRSLEMRERLELVARVADAVQHAHEHGVIHRDLKPSNILVDAAGQPKILDFGVARLTESDIQTVTVQTDAGQIIGTLDYMSPEQVMGDTRSLDARSDIYSLGVILFESLTGRLPHDLRGRPVPEAVRIIREEEPSRLSSRASARSGASGGTTTRFDRDVETIVTKALEKDRSRRYSSAAEFAADIRRHLHDEPIVARPASTFYQLRKFAKRNRALVGGVLATFVALLAGLMTVAAIARRESTQRAMAVEQRARAERQTYRSSLAAAIAAIQRQDGQAAIGYLDESPEALRDWEWSLVRRMADPSTPDLQPPWSGPTFMAEAGTDVIAWSIDRSSQTVSFASLKTGDRLGTINARVNDKLQVLPLADGRSALVFWVDGEMQVRTIADGALVWERRDLLPAWGVGVDPSGAKLALSTDLHRHVLVLDAKTGADVALLDASCYLPKPCFSPDGKVLAAGDRVIDLETRSELWKTGGQFQSFSGDGRLAAVVRGPESSPMSYIVDARTGEVRGSFATTLTFTWASPGVVFRPDGEVVYDLYSSSLLNARDLTTLEVISSALVRANAGSVLPTGALSVSPLDGRVMVNLGPQAGTRLFNATSPGSEFRVPVWNVSSYAADCSEDGSVVFRADWGTVSCTEANTGRVRWRRAIGIGAHYAVRASPENSRVAADGIDGRILLLRADDGRIERMIEAPEAGTQVASLGWVNEKALAVGYESGLVAIHDLESQSSPPRLLEGLRAPAVALAIHEESGRLAAGTEARGLRGTAAPATDPATALEFRVWKIQTGRQLFRGTSDTGVYSASFSADGTWLVVGVNGGLDAWDTTTWSKQNALRGASTPIRAVGWDRTGRRLWGAATNAKLHVWDSGLRETPALITFDLSKTPIQDVGFSPDGSRVVLASMRDNITLDLERPDAESMQERAKWIRACALARAAMDRATRISEVELKLNQRESLSPEDRSAAIELARAVGIHAPTLNSQAWDVVVNPTKSSADYALALARASGAAEVLRDNWAVLNTLGLAQFRTSNFEDAIVSLRQSDNVAHTETGRRRAANWAIIAMSQHALGLQDEARATLAEAKRMIAREPNAATDSTRSLVQEAERSIEK